MKHIRIKNYITDFQSKERYLRIAYFVKMNSATPKKVANPKI